MADENIITFNVTNWITVLLMAGIGFFLIGAAKRWYAAKQGS